MKIKEAFKIYNGEVRVDSGLAMDAEKVFRDFEYMAEAEEMRRLAINLHHREEAASRWV